jgi:hypothetical protein
MLGHAGTGVLKSQCFGSNSLCRVGSIREQLAAGERHQRRSRQTAVYTYTAFSLSLSLDFSEFRGKKKLTLYKDATAGFGEASMEPLDRSCFSQCVEQDTVIVQQRFPTNAGTAHLLLVPADKREGERGSARTWLQKRDERASSRGRSAQSDTCTALQRAGRDGDVRRESKEI